MTNFLIAYADIPRAAKVITTNATDSDLRSLMNVRYGRRCTSAYPTFTSPLTVTFDLGSGGDKAAEYFITPASLTGSNNTVLKLQSSSDGAAWTDRIGYASQSGKTLVGPASNDWLFTSTFNSDYTPSASTFRYWRVTLTDTDGTPHGTISKLYFGSWFDMGRDPETIDPAWISGSDSEDYPFGGRGMGKMGDGLWRIRISWVGITDAKRDSFISNILNDARQGFFLYTKSIAQLLMGYTLMHCYLVEHQIDNVTSAVSAGWNNISCTFDTYLLP